MSEGQLQLRGPSSAQYLPHQLVWRVMSSGISQPVIEPIVTPPPLMGKLTLVILRAKSLHNVCSFGSMDPFVEVKVGETRVRTSVAKKGHMVPDWSASGEKLEFDLNGQDNLLRLRVFHKTLLSETVIGTARLPIDTLVLHHGRSTAGASLDSPFNCANPTLNTAWIDLGREAKQGVPAGSVLVSVHFELASHAPLMSACTLSMDPARATRFVLAPDTPRPFAAASAATITTTPTSRTEADAQPFRFKQRAQSTSVPSLVLPAHQKQASRGSVAAPSSSPRPQLFGGTLANGMARSKSSVPVVVFICIQYLTHHGLKCVGLFRIASQAEAQEALKRSFESGNSIEVSDPHVTGDVLKSYFRLLLDPLIPSAMYDRFLGVTDIRHEETSVPMIRALLEQLPEANYTVLSYLLHFLTLVASHSDVNKMTAKNCAMIFSPNILRRVVPPQSETQASLAKEMAKSEDCIHLMLRHYTALFPEGPPTPFAMQHPNKDRPTVAPFRKYEHTPRPAGAHEDARELRKEHMAHLVLPDSASFPCLCFFSAPEKHPLDSFNPAASPLG